MTFPDEADQGRRDAPGAGTPLPTYGKLIDCSNEVGHQGAAPRTGAVTSCADCLTISGCGLSGDRLRSHPPYQPPPELVKHLGQSCLFYSLRRAPVHAKSEADLAPEAPQFNQLDFHASRRVMVLEGDPETCSFSTHTADTKSAP